MLVFAAVAAPAAHADLLDPFSIVDEWSFDLSFGGTEIHKDAAGHLYLTSSTWSGYWTTHVHELSASGTTREVWSVSSGFLDLAFDSDGNRYVSTGSHVRKFSPDGDSLDTWSVPYAGLPFNGNGALAIDGNEFVYAPGLNSVRQYTTSGTFVAEWEMVVKHPSTLRPIPDDVAVDDSGNVYLAIRSANLQQYSITSPGFAIRKYANDGRILTEWPLPDRYDSHHLYLAVDAGIVYLVSSNSMGWEMMIDAYTTSGEHLAHREYGLPDSPFFYAFGIEVDRFGRLLVSHVKPYGGGPPWVSVLSAISTRAAVAPEPPATMLPARATTSFTGFHAVEPNPFRGQTSLRFSLAEPQTVGAGIYDVTGRLLRRIEPASFDAGTHSLVWDGCDDSGRVSPAGLYLIRLQGDQVTGTRKVVHLGR
jgi:hypothetical protein